ncbi:helix-turn-helix domain-containing protein [Providencia burhodogranariea]|uniref:Fimbrial operon regulator n=1 Tax=Providencia burhodogranariea DSM 19968 TaxID=1141662 RepID=K8WNV3_9GAMM|nr:helix-turn-helix transcriptional regulator [Providencia burhodogranariea]EKT62288.1 fimbrial operon regulator [Providencia burhodogranariea DSM 19968]
MQMIESVRFFTSYDANKYLGTLFRLRRKEQKISELELSKLLGISQQQVSRYENGLTNFNIIILFKFFYALNMNSKEVEGIFNELKGFYSDSSFGGL